MKTCFQFFTLLFALVMLSCDHKADEHQSFLEKGTSMIFYATHETKTDSKTSLEESKIYWSAQDKINMFFGSSSAEFTSTNTSRSLTASFSGTLPVVFGSGEGSSSGITVMGLYPYNSAATCNDGTITTTLNNAQIATENTFSEGAYPSISQSGLPNVNLTFYNICGGIKFNVLTEGITTVILKGNNDEILAGTISVHFDSSSARPKVTSVTDGQKEIILTSESGFEVGKSYYIVSLPCTFTKGLTLRFEKSNMYSERKINASHEIKRSVWGVINNVDNGLLWIPKGTPGNNQIWYTSSDGNVVTPSNPDVFGATIQSNEYENGFGVITFSGDVTSIGKNAFNSCFTLTSVILPNTAKSIGISSFDSCAKLAFVSLPSSLLSIGTYAFNSCTDLPSVEMPNSVTSISSSAFYSCSNLQSIKLSNSLLSIGDKVFARCRTLSSIEIPSTVTSLGSSALSECDALTEVVIPNSVKSIGTLLFNGCSLLQSVVLPNAITSVSAKMFKNCLKLLSVDIPATVTSIGDEAFNGCASLTDINCNPVTPPAAGTNFLLNTPSLTHIYVPSESVDSYKAASGWQTYASMIGTLD